MGSIPVMTDRSSVESAHVGGKLATTPIAIIGMACRLPGDIYEPEQLWKFCSEARSAWSEWPDDRFNSKAFSHPFSDKRSCFHTQGGHFLQDVSHFDAQFFNITAAEARAMDPQQRILLESAYEALESAGITLDAIYDRKVGTFVGGSFSDYTLHTLRDLETLPVQHMTGTADAILSNRLSYFFGIHGPSLTCDTACSSGLTAFHLACQSLRLGESSEAIVAGSHLNLSPEYLITKSNLKLLSAEGKSFAFDHRANGYGPGEGVCCLILKPLDRALAAGDPIRAVVRNSGVNQDGRTQGLTMPSSEAQIALAQSVYLSASLDPKDTDFIEAHGTGTHVGDPIEARAIHEVFRPGQSAQNPIYIGSVKSNIGHLEGTSGLAAMIKATLMLEKSSILPNADFERVHPDIPLEEWGIKITNAACPWPHDGTRRISVSNFGFGGTNAHIILEEAPRSSPTIQQSEPITQNGTNGVELQSKKANANQIFVLTANDKDSVTSYAAKLGAYLKQSNLEVEADFLHRLAYTLGQHRSILPWKLAMTSQSSKDLIEQLKRADITPLRSKVEPRIGFIFTGQGAQWHAMGRELMDEYSIFRSAIDDADSCLLKLGASWSLKDELRKDAASSRIGEAYLSQPACTAIQIALVLLYRSWNIHPRAVVGHSSGEIGAAFAAGALDLDTCMSLAYFRGVASTRLRDEHPSVKGAMLAVGANEDEASLLIGNLGDEHTANVACINSPSNVTISGDESAITRIEQLAKEKGYFNRRLQVDVAYHSHHMKLVMENYRSAIGKVKASTSKAVRFYSSLTGVEINTLLLGSSYWVRNLTSPVRFAPALTSMCMPPGPKAPKSELLDVLVEIGPHSALQGPIREIMRSHAEQTKNIQYLASLVRKQDSVKCSQELACALFMKGCQIDLKAINDPLKHNARPALLSDLPLYCWKHTEPYWHESRISRSFRFRDFGRNDILGLRTLESPDKEPAWRNVISLESLPWLEDHRIQSQVTCPMSFFICMAVEAAYQKATLKKEVISSYKLRDIRAGKALVIPESSDVETLITFHRGGEDLSDRSSSTWDDFTVYSSTLDGGWLEHCRGCIAVEAAGDAKPSINIATDETLSRIRLHATSSIDADRMYKMSAEYGNEIGPLSRGLFDCSSGPDLAHGTVKIPDTIASMPSQVETRYVIHPVLLDTCFHITFPIINSDTEASGGAPIPSHIDEMSIRADFADNSDRDLEVFSSGLSKDLSARTIETLLVLKPGENSTPLIEIKDYTFKLLSSTMENTGKKDKDFLCSKLSWKPSFDLSDPVLFQEICSLPSSDQTELETVRSVEQASFYFLEKALDGFKPTGAAVFPEHLSKFYKWAQDKSALVRSEGVPLQNANWLTLEAEQRENFLRTVRSSGIEGELVCKIGENLPKILRNEQETLSLLLEDDLLSRYYRTLDALSRNYEEAAIVVEHLAHQNPAMKIIEIGAGTGGTTLPVLEALGMITDEVPRFQQYNFTDLSTGFFESTGQTVGHWKDYISFTRLDIEQDPLDQGFEAGGFDLVIAANCLHATLNMTRTMNNVRKLLRPGGRLLMIEETVHSLRRFPFATLPGWWLAEEPERNEGPLFLENQWDTLLKETGFSGIDGSVHDYAGHLEHTGSVILSSAVAKDPPSVVDEVIIISSNPSDRLSLAALESALSEVCKAAPKTLPFSQINQVDISKTLCILLDEIDGSLLLDPSAQDFDDVKNLCRAKGIVWVVQGACDGSISAESNLAFGLARTIRNENEGMKFVTLDLDAQNRLSPTSTAEIIAKVFKVALVQPSFSHEGDNEYQERNGQVFISRQVNGKNINRYIAQQTDQAAPQQQTFDQGDRSLRLQAGKPADLDSLYYVDDEVTTSSLADDEIEIRVKATGLSAGDVLIANKALPNDRLGRECSGVVTAIGRKVKTLKKGDRICAFVNGACSTQARCSSHNAVKIPDNLSYACAASIPVAFSTAYFCVTELARLTSADSILVCSGTEPVGQAALSIAQNVGAAVYTTVRDDHEREFLRDRLRIQDNHIFSYNDSALVQHISKANLNHGMDVVLIAESNDAFETPWQCLAPFGRFIEYGKRTTSTDQRTKKAKLPQNGSYLTFDLESWQVSKAMDVTKVLATVSNMIFSGKLHMIDPVTEYSMSEVGAALGLLQEKQPVGKLVAVPKVDDQVKASQRVQPISSVREDATYVITGGGGGLGRAMAKWFVNHGARHIAMLSRRAADNPKVQDLIRELADIGAHVRAFNCDVTIQEEVENVIQTCSKTMPPIRGAVHGAMVLEDKLFQNSTLSSYQTVVRPRVQGTLHLHHALSASPLDFFIMLSSTAGMIGNRGQASYAATTGFLDAFASFRNRRHLPATTLDLGMIQGVGYVAERAEQLSSVLDEYVGVEGVREDEFLSLLGAAVSGLVESDSAWHLTNGLRLKRDVPEPFWLSEPKFAYLRAIHTAQQRSDSSGGKLAGPQIASANSAAERLKHALSFGEAKEIAYEALSTKIADSLGVPVEDIVPDKPTASYGLDSIVAITIRNWAKTKLGSQLPFFDLLAGSTMEALAEHVVRVSTLVDPRILGEEEEG